MAVASETAQPSVAPARAPDQASAQRIGSSQQAQASSSSAGDMHTYAYNWAVIMAATSSTVSCVLLLLVLLVLALGGQRQGALVQRQRAAAQQKPGQPPGGAKACAKGTPLLKRKASKDSRDSKMPSRLIPGASLLMSRSIFLDSSAWDSCKGGLCLLHR